MSAISTPMTRFFTLLFALLMLMAAPAFAGDPFTVGGVKVDATAKTAIEAQTVAIQDGQMRAAQALIARLTLESERAAKPTPEALYMVSFMLVINCFKSG